MAAAHSIEIMLLQVHQMKHATLRPARHVQPQRLSLDLAHQPQSLRNGQARLAAGISGS